MPDRQTFLELIQEYESLSESLAPLAARFAAGGTNIERKATLKAKIYDEYLQRLLLLDRDGAEPSEAILNRLVHSDSRFLDFIDQTENHRTQYFSLAAKRRVVQFKLRDLERLASLEEGSEAGDDD